MRKLNQILMIYSMIFVLLVLPHITFFKNDAYLLLIWNLLLAWIPHFFASTTLISHRKGQKIRAGLFFVGWLLFFPNSLYLITDVIHIENMIGFSFGYHMGVLLLLAIIGIGLMYSSYTVIRSVITHPIYQIFILVIASFGLYIGRFLRFNSWDVLHNPISLVVRSFSSLLEPETWIFVSLFTLISFLITATFDALRDTPPVSAEGEE